jgi:hypothetical protein
VRVTDLNAQEGGGGCVGGTDSSICDEESKAFITSDLPALAFVPRLC